MLRLARLDIEAFRDVEQGASFRFGAGVHLILGRNASGKTNLLKLLAMIGKSDFSALAGEAFAFRWRVEGDDGAWMEGNVRQRREEHPPRPGLDLEAPARTLFEAKVTLCAAGNELHVWGSSADGWSCRLGNASEVRLDGAPALTDPSGLQSVCWIALEQTADAHGWGEFLALILASPGRLDEGLLFFHEVLGFGAPSAEVTPGVPRWQADAAKRIVLTRSAFGVPSGKAAAGEVSTPEEGPLRALVAVLGATELRATPIEQASSQAPSGGAMTMQAGVRFRVEFGGRSISDPALLSYGQRRLIAFFWYAACAQDGFLVCDEPGNGLHHDWLRACFEAVSDRQAFFAAQDPLVFDHVEFQGADDVRARLILCGPSPELGVRRWRWRQPTESEATEFMAAYDVGIQQVSAILRTHGLW